MKKILIRTKAREKKAIIKFRYIYNIEQELNCVYENNLYALKILLS